MKHTERFSLQYPSPLLGTTLIEKAYHIFAIPSLVNLSCFLGDKTWKRFHRIKLTVAFIQLKEDIYGDILRVLMYKSFATIILICNRVFYSTQQFFQVLVASH